MRKLSTLAAIAFITVVFSANTGHSQVVVKVRPPRPKVVVKKPARPGPKFVWIDGHWRWNRKQHKYVWVAGHWTQPKRGHKWIPGHWASVPGGHKWIPGHWARY